jgi:hypothetical protein
MSKSLALILHEKVLLETELEGSGGEITGELDKVWENNTLELAEKIDNYAWVLKHLDALITTLRERSTKASQMIKTIENQQRRIKKRLNHYCVETSGPLRGHEYSFHPYLSKKSEVSQERVENKYRKVVVTMPLEEWVRLRNENLIQAKSVKVIHPPVKVSELPEGHPAVFFSEEPSVRMR